MPPKKKRITPTLIGPVGSSAKKGKKKLLPGKKRLKQRAKPKPKAAQRETVLAPPEIESDSSESADEATLQEIHSLNLLRSIRAYESTKQARKQQLYASWFGR